MPNMSFHRCGGKAGRDSQLRAPIYKPNRRFGFNMTPMIDVVFLLIIFFLVSSHLARQESRLELELPTAAAGDEDTDQLTPRVTVNVKPDGTLWLAGRVIDPPNLARRLESLREENGDNLEVRIRSSRKAVYSHVEPIMLACTRTGIWNVTYAVYREEP